MAARALVVGLDGFDLRLVEQFGPEKLPHIHAIMNRGAYAPLQSVQPPATLPNWTTFLTGVDPAQHGVFDFTTRRGYQVRFTAGTVREAPTVFKRLDELGLRCACLSFPGTWPPEKLAHGAFVSGWDAPVAFQADRSFMWPPSLYDETVRRFGAPTFDDVDEFNADAPGWIERLASTLIARVQRKTQWAQWLLQKQDWDVFAIYFGESDTASHYLWAHHDPDSPRRPASVTHETSVGLSRVYEALNEAVGVLAQTAGGSRTAITLLSDHGSGGSSDKVLYLNRLLAEHGLLRFRTRHVQLGARLKELALRRLPPRLRERLFRISRAWLPSRLESNVRFGAIDMAHTLAFSDELNYFPGVYLNVLGREPQGIVTLDKTREAILRVQSALLGARDPWSGRPVFRAVIPREELFEGPYLDRAPDLLLDLHLDGDYSYNLMPSPPAPQQRGRTLGHETSLGHQPSFGHEMGHQPSSNAFRKLREEEKPGKKGRSLPGSHRPHGFMALAGPTVRPVGRIDAAIADVTATLLYQLGLPVPTSLHGRVLWEALHADADSQPLPESSQPVTESPRPFAKPVRPPPELSGVAPVATRDAAAKTANEGIVESRLRTLGYIE